MKRRALSTSASQEHVYDNIFTMLFEFAGPNDEFVFAFVVNGLAHLAFVPERNDYARPTLANIARISKFFYRAYQTAHATIIFPELDRRFRAFAEAYEAWKPEASPWCPSESRKLYHFEPLQFKTIPETDFYKGRSLPVVAQLSVLHWLARHRYPRPMSTECQENVNKALRSYDWISWFQNVIKRDPEWNILGRPWHTHDVPTLACAAIAHSHRCVDGAVDALMWAYIGDSSRERQREFITVWIFFAMTASLWNLHCVMHGQWAARTSDMVAMDKIRDHLLLNRTAYDDWENDVVF